MSTEHSPVCVITGIETSILPLSQTIQALSIPSFLLNDQGIVLSVNPAFSRLLGKDPEQLMEQKLSECIPNLSDLPWTEIAGKLTPEQPVYDYQIALCSDQSLEQIQYKLQIQRLELPSLLLGQILPGSASAIDLKGIPENNPHFIAQFSREGDIIYMNPVLKSFLETNNHSGDLFSLLPSNLDELLKQRNSHQIIETKYLNNDYRWHIITPEEIGPTTLYGYDISQYKEHHDELSCLFALSPEMMLITHFDTSIKMANPMVYEMLGYTPLEMLNKPFKDFIHPDDYDSALSEFNKIADGQNTFHYEMRVFTKSGETRWTLWSAYADTDKKTVYSAGRDITRYKELEEKLAGSERKFKTIADAAPAMLWMGSNDGSGYKYVNMSWLKFSGRPEAEELGFGWTDNIHPDDLETYMEIYHQAITTQRSYQTEYRFKRHDGEYRWVWEKGCPVFNSEGECTDYVGSVIDITDERQLYMELIEIKEMFRSAFDNAALGMAMVSPLGRFIRVNEALCQMLGYSEEELVGLHFNDITYLDDTLTGIDLIMQLLNGTVKNINFEKRYVHKHGYLIWAQVTSSLVRNTSGEPLYFISQLQNINHRKQMEGELKESERFAHGTVDSLSAHIAIINEEGIIIAVNQAWREFGTIHGIMEDHACLGVSYFEVCNPGGQYGEYACQALTGIRSVLNQEAEFFHLEYPIESNGTILWFDMRVTPFEGEGPVKVVIAHENITLTKLAEEQVIEANKTLRRLNRQLKQELYERKFLESQLIQAQKMESVGQLAAGVAHEINNPVAFVKSNLETLEEYLQIYLKLVTLYEKVTPCLDPVSRERAAEYLSAIEELQKQEHIECVSQDIFNLMEESKEGLRRVIEIVRSLKSFARKDEEKKQMADINECIKTTLKVVWNELKYKCKVIVDLGELPLIPCHPGQLNQVLMNLLVNAAQAIPEKGEIVIETKAEPEKVIIRISDNGQGIAEEHLSKIFNPFFTTKPISTGTGLGLSITYDIIQKHGGNIEVSSKLGLGTTFTIHLPRQ